MVFTFHASRFTCRTVSISPRKDSNFLCWFTAHNTYPAPTRLIGRDAARGRSGIVFNLILTCNVPTPPSTGEALCHCFPKRIIVGRVRCIGITEFCRTSQKTILNVFEHIGTASANPANGINDLPSRPGTSRRATTT